MARASKLDLIPGLDAPCGDISYSWDSQRENGLLLITLHFANVVEGFSSNVQLSFMAPISIQWEEESFGLIELPEILPKLTNPKFFNWTYPMFTIVGSSWADKYAGQKYAGEEFKSHRVTHYCFISLNDILHVLSESVPTLTLLSEGPNE